MSGSIKSSSTTSGFCSRAMRRPSLPELGHEHFVTGLAQVVLQHLLEIGFVFDDQNACHPRNRVPGNCDDCVAAG